MQVDLGSVLVGALLTLVGALSTHLLTESSTRSKRQRDFKTLLNLLERDLQIVEAVTASPEAVNPVHLPSLRLLIDRDLVDLMTVEVRDSSLNVETTLEQMQWLGGMRERLVRDAPAQGKSQVWELLGKNLEGYRRVVREELTHAQTAVRQQLLSLGVKLLIPETTTPAAGAPVDPPQPGASSTAEPAELSRVIPG